jgi:multidrug transporter EmrE-like cation transporter
VTIGTLLLILFSVSLSALAQVSFKFGVNETSAASLKEGGALAFALALVTPGVLGGLALYGLGTLIWLSVLRRIDVSQAYPFIGLGIALTGIMGYFFFGEALSLQRVLGMLLIIGGIVVVAWS